MTVQKPVLRETAYIFLGLLICAALEAAVFVLLSRFSISVLLGILIGTVFAVLNFFLMCLGIQKAMEKTEGQAKAVKRSYALRMLMIVAVLAASYFAPFVDVIAVCVPFLATKPVIYVVKLLETKKQKAESAGDDNP